MGKRGKSASKSIFHALPAFFPSFTVSTLFSVFFLLSHFLFSFSNHHRCSLFSPFTRYLYSTSSLSFSVFSLSLFSISLYLSFFSLSFLSFPLRAMCIHTLEFSFSNVLPSPVLASFLCPPKAISYSYSFLFRRAA